MQLGEHVQASYSTRQADSRSRPQSQKPHDLTVCLITYNHVNYIQRTLDSILSQITSFGWHLTVYDDHSTDGTTEILEWYRQQHPGKIHLHVQAQNVGAAENWKQMLQSVSTEFAAYIEGDDYWTDDYKLQKQYSVLRENPSVGLVYAQAMARSSRTHSERVIGRKLTRCTLCIGNAIPALTVMFRSVCLNGFFEQLGSSLSEWKMGDYALWLWIATKWRILFIPEPVGVYRVLESSATRQAPKRKWLTSKLATLRFFRAKQTNIALKLCYLIGEAEILLEMMFHATRGVAEAVRRPRNNS